MNTIRCEMKNWIQRYKKVILSKNSLDNSVVSGHDVIQQSINVNLVSLAIRQHMDSRPRSIIRILIFVCLHVYFAIFMFTIYRTLAAHYWGLIYHQYPLHISLLNIARPNAWTLGLEVLFAYWYLYVCMYILPFFCLRSIGLWPPIIGAL